MTATKGIDSSVMRAIPTGIGRRSYFAVPLCGPSQRFGRMAHRTPLVHANHYRVEASTPIIPLADREASHFHDLPLDRAGELREHAASFLDKESTRVITFVDGKALVVPYDETSSPCTFWSGFSSGKGSHPMAAEGTHQATHVPLILSVKESIEVFGDPNDDPGFVFLGVMKHNKDVAVFVRTVSHIPEACDPSVKAVDVRKYGPDMCTEDASVLALSSGLLSWHKNTQYCSITGERASHIVSAGHARRVPDNTSSRSLYPRIDPAVIVGVTHGEWMLLGRKSSWVPGRYSLLAGFVELGESLEHAAMREVSEESGVQLDHNSIQYHSSQPWPFPQSLMVGFKAQTCDIISAPHGWDILSKEGQQAAKHVGLLEDEIESLRSHASLPLCTVDENELEDARFFHYSWLAEQLGRLTTNNHTEPTFRIPGKHAIANKIIHQTITEFIDRKRTQNASLEQVESIKIPLEDTASMKYILIRVSAESPEGGWESKLIVRGDPRAPYHNNIFVATKSEIGSTSVDMDVLGGGRIEIDVPTKRVSIYGFSAAFGQAPHEVTAAILKASLPFHTFNVSYDGY